MVGMSPCVIDMVTRSVVDGQPVVCIGNDMDGTTDLPSLSVPILTSDTLDPETLARAGIARARGAVFLSDSDADNLRGAAVACTAAHARPAGSPRRASRWRGSTSSWASRLRRGLGAQRHRVGHKYDADLSDCYGSHTGSLKGRTEVKV